MKKPRLIAMVCAVIGPSFPGVADRGGMYGLPLAWDLILAGGLLLIGGLAVRLVPGNPMSDSEVPVVGPGGNVG